MKSAFQKDRAFIGDVEHALASGLLRFWWLGQSGFLIVQKGQAVIFDPYLSDSLTLKYANTDKPHIRITERVAAPEALAVLGCVQIITSTHNHTDHLDAETLQPLLQENPNARLVIPFANHDFVLERLGTAVSSRLIELDHEQSKTEREVTITGIAAAHNNAERDALGRHKFLGYVVQWLGLTVYHSGDTVWHEPAISALRHFKIDLALLPINGDRPERRVAGNLDGPQAARMARAINASLAIPCHYDMFEFNTASPDDFVTECRRLKQRFHVLQNGEGFDLSLRNPPSAWSNCA
jgi:L-ascorbate metabolism protein UlaG (beta-lactamase superfamily)